MPIFSQESVCLGKPPTVAVGQPLQWWRASGRGVAEPLAAVVIDLCQRRDAYPDPNTHEIKLLVFDRAGRTSVEMARYNPKVHGGWSLLDQHLPLVR